MTASGQTDMRQSAGRWRRHTFLIFTGLVLDPSRVLAFYSIHLISELTPPSASDEALLFSHPVTFNSTNPPLGALARDPFMVTSPEAACRNIALLAFPLRMLGLLLPLDVRDVRSSLLELGGGVGFPILPRPLIAMSIFRSPSRSGRAPPLSCLAPPLRFAAGPRGALRGLCVRAAMVAAGTYTRYLSNGVRTAEDCAFACVCVQ